MAIAAGNGGDTGHVGQAVEHMQNTFLSQEGSTFIASSSRLNGQQHAGSIIEPERHRMLFGVWNMYRVLLHRMHTTDLLHEHVAT